MEFGIAGDLQTEGGIAVKLVVRGACASRHLREIGVEFFGQNHRYRRVDALPHLDLRHDQRCLAFRIDADKGVRREFAGCRIRRLHRFVHRAQRKMKREQESARQSGASKTRRREGPSMRFFAMVMARSYDWRPEAACLMAARIRT